MKTEKYENVNVKFEILSRRCIAHIAFIDLCTLAEVVTRYTAQHFWNIQYSHTWDTKVFHLQNFRAMFAQCTLVRVTHLVSWLHARCHGYTLGVMLTHSLSWLHIRYHGYTLVAMVAPHLWQDHIWRRLKNRFCGNFMVSWEETRAGWNWRFSKREESVVSEQGLIHDYLCRGRLGRGSNELGRGSIDQNCCLTFLKY